MMRARGGIVVTGGVLAIGLLAVSPAGCAADMRVGNEGNQASPTLDPPNASDNLEEPVSGGYCPSNKCPAGYATCSTSKFLCDVDLRSDPQNCGECGSACPEDGTTEDVACVDGHCVMRCKTGYADCDGLIGNRCEVELGKDPRHCRACGDVCDRGLPCVQVVGKVYDCGCGPGETYCPDAAAPQRLCTDSNRDDRNCGGCKVECDPAGAPGAAPPLPNAYYGCVGAKCGHLKCVDGWADCNGDLDLPSSDGCEARLDTHENCTKCGDDCLSKGMHCVRDSSSGATACQCPAGRSFCGISNTNPYDGSCSDLSSDPLNCGGCGNRCHDATSRSRGVCVGGMCKLECAGRWADCNGNTDDDCEVDIFSDPRNCGGCGTTCDLAAGQACAGGRCVVEPCPDGGA